MINEEGAIDLLAIAQELWKNILAIALVAVIVGTAAFGYTAFMIEPTYKATAALYVNNSSFSIGSSSISVSAGELSTSSSLVNTYLYILKSRTTLEQVLEEAGLNYSTSQLSSMISTRSVSGTAAFEVTVTSSKPAECELIANSIAKVLPDRISEIVDGSSARIVDYAIIPSYRSGPDLMRNTAMGILAGAALCAAFVVLRSLLDQKSRAVIASADELRTMYPDIMVLSMIPDMRSSEKKNGYYSSYYYTDDSSKKKGVKKDA